MSESGALPATVEALLARVGALEQRLERAELRVRDLEEEVRELRESSIELVEATPAAASSADQSEVASSDSAGRRLLAEGIGHFIKRCLRGGSRGSSGRDRLKLRIYVVIADFNGRRLPEPVVETSFARVRELCK